MGPMAAKGPPNESLIYGRINLSATLDAGCRQQIC